MLQYLDSTPIRTGDRVVYHDRPGVVVFVIEADEYSPAFPKEHWSYLKQGFMIQLDDGALFHLDDADDHLRRTLK